jgi:hypothetical protein
MEPLEIIYDNGEPTAYLINGAWCPEETEFVTPDCFNQQLGMIVYDAGESIQPHRHLPITREIVGTTECVVVKKGKCLIDLYNSKNQVFATRELKTGDIVLLISGAHGFRMIEDTVLFEVKQGPYAGESDKIKLDLS